MSKYYEQRRVIAEELAKLEFYRIADKVKIETKWEEMPDTVRERRIGEQLPLADFVLAERTLNEQLLALGYKKPDNEKGNTI